MASQGRISQLTPRAREIALAARELLEADGVEALSTRRLAERLGIRAPSLYSHFANKQQLENALIADGLWELSDRLTAAAHDGDDPIADIGRAYRGFALERPHLFRLMYSRSWDRTQQDPEAELRARRALWDATGHDLVFARVVWAFAYGLVDLELSDRFPQGGPTVDELWNSGMEALKAAYAKPAAATTTD